MAALQSSPLTSKTPGRNSGPLRRINWNSKLATDGEDLAAVHKGAALIGERRSRDIGVIKLKPDVLDRFTFRQFEAVGFGRTRRQSSLEAA